MILYEKLKAPYQDHKLCPNNFFTLENTGINVPEEKQQRIFKLLKLKEIVEILVGDKGALDSNCDLVDLFKKEEIIEKLRSKAVSDHRSGLMEILAEIDQLKQLPQYLGDDSICTCNRLWEKIQEAIPSMLLKKLKIN